jgi:hypothetical protein
MRSPFFADGLAEPREKNVHNRQILRLSAR